MKISFLFAEANPKNTYINSTDYFTHLIWNSFLCFLYYCRFDIVVNDGVYKFWVRKISYPPVWIHLAINYIGPSDGQGVWIYVNGQLEGMKDTKEPGSYPEGEGQVVLCRAFSDKDAHYAG